MAFWSLRSTMAGMGIHLAKAWCLKKSPGSGSRGGWHQTLVFVALFVGLGVILWRVSRGIRANRVALDATVPDRDTEHT